MTGILQKLRGRPVQFEIGEGVAPVVGILWDIFDTVALVVSWQPGNALGLDGKSAATQDFILQWVDIKVIRKTTTDALVRVFPEARRRALFDSDPLFRANWDKWHAINNAVSLAICDFLKEAGIDSGFEGVYVNAEGKRITRGEAQKEIDELRTQAKAIPASPVLTVAPSPDGTQNSPGVPVSAQPTPEQIVPVNAVVVNPAAPVSPN
jgi:hypothetical protein